MGPTSKPQWPGPKGPVSVIRGDGRGRRNGRRNGRGDNASGAGGMDNDGDGSGENMNADASVYEGRNVEGVGASGGGSGGWK